MMICVNTPPTYRRLDLQNKTIEVEDGKTLVQFMIDVKLSDSSVAYVMINKKKAEMTQTLQHGDQISFLPMMAGG